MNHRLTHTTALGTPISSGLAVAETARILPSPREFDLDGDGGAYGAGMVLGRADLRNVTVCYRDAARELPLVIGVDELKLRSEEDEDACIILMPAF